MTKKVKMLSGFELEIDGDLMAVIESLYHEVVIKKELKHTYQDMKQEIDNIVASLDLEDLKNYLAESIFMNTVTYENQMIELLVDKLTSDKEE